MTDTKKKPKTGSKAVDPKCRNNGTCPACQKSRSRKEKLAKKSEEEQLVSTWCGSSSGL